MSLRRDVISFFTAAALALVGAGGVSPSDFLDRLRERVSPRATTSFDLPVGFRPEGIDVRKGSAYLGSLADGSIYELDLRTGDGDVLSPAVGRPAVGVEVDGGRLFVAGGGSGTARVIDTGSGAVLAEYQLAPTGTAAFINDVVVTEEAAWFTDSVNPVLYRIPLGPGGALPAAGAVTALAFSGELSYDDDPQTFEVNGIETTPDGRALLVVQSSTGVLFRVDPASGATSEVDLGGAVLTNGDGLTRDGHTLYAVQNRLNRIAVITLARDGARGQVDRRITDPLLDVPTTVAVSGSRLYLPNARFGIPSPETARYSVVGVPRR